MVNIKISKGLNIPIEGEPQHTSEILALKHPHLIGLDLSPFDDVKFKTLVRVGDTVKLGQPLLEDKDSPGRYFVSPAGGLIREIRRGLKRRLLDVVIEVAQKEEIEQHPILSPKDLSREEMIQRLKLGGLFTHIRQRPFNFLANPHKTPRSIFIKALESAPFTPPSELQLIGYEHEFQVGIEVLSKLTDGDVHLVYRHETNSLALTEAQGVVKHTAEGPHPVANASLHIERIDPILSPEDVVWTLNVHAVISIGYFFLHGQYFVPRVIAIAGPGVLDGKVGYFKAREGYPISALLEGRVKKGVVRLISGNPLTGHQVEPEDFLGYEDFVFCIFPENTKREFLHFLRIGGDKYTFSKTYLSGHLDNSERRYHFSTNQHGENRPFIDSSLYEKVMPLNIPTMHLIKAVLAEDFDLATQLGLLEVDSEDFALPSFVCPSKIEMPSIIKEGLRRYASDILK